MKRDLEKDLKYKIIEYKRIYLHKLIEKRLYSLLDNFVSENDNKEYENFSNKLFRPIDIDIYDITVLNEYILDSTTYLKDLINQESYYNLIKDYYVSQLDLSNDEEVYSNFKYYFIKGEIHDNIMNAFIEGEAYRIFIHLLDSHNEKELDKLIKEIDIFIDIDYSTLEEKIIKVFSNKLYFLLHCFLNNIKFEEDIRDIAYNLDSSKITLANDNLIRIFEEKNIFKHIDTDTNLFSFFFSKPNDFLSKIPLIDDDSAYNKILDGIEIFSINYGTKSSNIAKLKEVLLSDNFSFPKTTSDYDEENIKKTLNYTYQFFLTSILHYVISDDMLRYKHSYDLRRTENKNTFIKNTNINSKKDSYFTKQYYDLVLKYTNDFKRRENLFLIHLCFFMSISPDDALQIANVLGFYKHKSKKEALKTFNEDIVILYPNFKLLKSTSFFVKN